ncbi:cytochrome P450 [Sordaria brevicollis]|uniref:Cytochrome P450 n=1 Tax=Sordaria brevicollis TaxID=83679 RepID=A0AAE0U2Q8_SORBR|nr:cytochrome P450 [Sordaria brevicollis]
MTGQFIKGDVHVLWKDLAEKYGPLVRFGPDQVLCTDLESILRITSVRSNYRKSDWYDLARMGDDDNLLSMTDKERRKERRKKVAPAYNGKGAGSHTFSIEAGLDRALTAWTELIDRKYLASGPIFQPFDIAQSVHFYALDSLGEIAYSQSLGYIANDKDMNDVLKINEATLPWMYLLNNHHFFFKLLRKWPFSLLLPRAGDKAGLGAIMGHTTSIIDQRLALSSSEKKVPLPDDMLQSFISHHLTRPELQEEVTVQLFAGSDTVANGIRLCLLHLFSSPRIYRKLQAELDSAYPFPSVSSSSPGPSGPENRTPIPVATCLGLPYLQAVLRESLRILPPVATGGFYKDVSPSGDTVMGFDLPPGTKVATGAAIYAMCHSRAIFGEDADVFRPERWLEAEEAARLESSGKGKREGTGMGEAGKRLKEMEMTLGLIFGHGQFECVGKKLAMMQMNKVVAELVRRYDFTVLNPVRPCKVENALMWLVKDFWVRVERR